LSVSDIDGDDNLGGSFFDPAGYAETAIPPAYLRLLQQLLNQRQIGAALHAAPLPPSTPATPAAVPSS
jgi:hypothetical protein